MDAALATAEPILAMTSDGGVGWSQMLALLPEGQVQDDPPNKAYCGVSGVS